MINVCSRVALSLCVLAAAAASQNLSVTITPDPAPQGVPITVTALDAFGQGLHTPAGCLVTGISANTPGGPSVTLFACTLLPVAIPACGSGQAPRMSVWNQTVMGGAQAAPGVYWFRIDHSPTPFGQVTTEWYCVTIEGPTPVPALSALSAPQVGTTFLMGLDAPGQGSAFYVVALAGTTNSGQALGGGLTLCLDSDALFALSFPTPLPGALLNFQGTLDVLGSTTSIGLVLPGDPALARLPFHAQAAVLPAGGGILLSNDLPVTLQ